jgi:hypothetical protein
MDLKKQIRGKLKKNVLRFFSNQRIDVADKNGECIYFDDFSETHKFSLFVDNPKGNRAYFLGLIPYSRKPMLIAYLSFLTDDKWVLHIQGKKNMEWGEKQKKSLEEMCKGVRISIIRISDENIFQKKRM